MAKSKTVAIIQARMGSTRLPGKVIGRIGGKTLIEILISRLRRSHDLHEIAIATTTGRIDDVIVHLSEDLGIRCYRGSENDVLERYFQAAKYTDAKVIARVTSDNPLTSVRLLDALIEAHKRDNADYTHSGNAILGTGSEIISVDALATANAHAELQSEREHVTPFIRNHPDLFSLLDVDSGLKYDDIRLTVDTKEDLLMIEKIYNCLGDLENLEIEEVIEFLMSRPDVKEMNAHACQKRI